jgi:phosphoinositide-3-kinase regulatory subunit 4
MLPTPTEKRAVSQSSSQLPVFERPCSTRPFLTSIEKTWITFQLLKAIERCHFYGICHGDLKCENVMVTSWNWIYLTDFALYKPTYLPEDNPADYSYFFDSSGRRLCYIAPERFYGASRGQSASGQPNGAGATPSAAPLVQPSTVQDIGELETTMDIFSLGYAHIFVMLTLF